MNFQIAITFIMTLCLPIFASFGEIPLADNIQGAWDFNTASDTVINATVGLDGAIVGTDYTREESNIIMGFESYISLPRENMFESSFTMDYWFSYDEGGDHGSARIFSAAPNLAGTGPEAFLIYNTTSFRLDNDNVIFSNPSVGSVKSPSGPPDHWALPSQTLTTKTLTHWILVHDMEKKNITMYQAETNDKSMIKTYEGNYRGTHQVVVDDIRLNDSHDPGQRRRTIQSAHQLIIYNSVFSEADANKSHSLGEYSLAEVKKDSVSDVKRKVAALPSEFDIAIVSGDKGVTLNAQGITDNSSQTVFEIFSKNGRRLMKKTGSWESMVSGVVWSGGGHEAGMYIARIHIGNKILSKQFSLLK
ncbi:MAG: hypothetical protein HQK83_20645 [Fibrobacteria bacterium]|nr:hypothetical protein [Fibrobacteria bacterium]